MNKIYVDVDDTIMESLACAVKLIDPTKKVEDITEWSLKDIKPDITEKEVSDLFSSDEFFSSVIIRKDFVEFYNKYNNQLHFVFLTKGVPLNHTKKIRLLKPLFPRATYIPIGMTESKKPHVERGSIQVDDVSDNFSDLAKQTYIIKLYNKTFPWMKPCKAHCVTSWEEIESHLLKNKLIKENNYVRKTH